MAVHGLRFAFVCQKKWGELTGDDPVKRHCESCDKTITNLDPLTKEEVDQLFRDAVRTGVKPCVFATVRGPGGTDCGYQPPQEGDEFLDDMAMLGGEPQLEVPYPPEPTIAGMLEVFDEDEES